MNGGKTAVVTGVHRLKHIQCFAAAALTDHDPVGAHTQRVADEVTDGDCAAAFDVGRAGFQTDEMFLMKLEFGGIFDGDDTFAVRQKTAEYVEQCGFTGTGTSGDDDVFANGNTYCQKVHHIVGDRTEVDQVLGLERFFGKFTDGDRWPHQRQRGL